MKQENHKFVEWYNSLKDFDKKRVDGIIMATCQITKVTLWRWIKGESEIKNPYRIILNQIAKENLFDTIELAQFN